MSYRINVGFRSEPDPEPGYIETWWYHRADIAEFVREIMSAIVAIIVVLFAFYGLLHLLDGSTPLPPSSQDIVENVRVQISPDETAATAE